MAAMHYEQQPLVYIRDKSDYLRSKQIPPTTLYLLDTLIQSANLASLTSLLSVPFKPQSFREAADAMFLRLY